MEEPYLTSRNYIEYRPDRGLMVGGIPAARLAKKYGTPLYVYSEDAIVERMREYTSSFSKAYPDSAIAYASKAYLTMRMAQLVNQEGLYIDTASGGELYIALQSGFPPERIMLHGNNKSNDELEMAITAGVGRIVVDNFDELTRLQRIARKEKRVQGVHLRLTPGIDAHTHRSLSTGEISSKFGIALGGEEPFLAAIETERSPNLSLMGIHCHIGSQIFEAAPYAEAIRVMLGFAAELNRRTGIVVRELNLGGGLGVNYMADGVTEIDPSAADHCAFLAREVMTQAQELGIPLPRLFTEPGRSIVAPAAVTLYTVGTVKDLPNGETVVAVDGGMADNPRPALYGAKYRVIPAFPERTPERVTVRVVGKHCEEGDVLIERTEVPPLRPGDIIALPVSGAYQYSMRSNYNALLHPAVVHVSQGNAFLVVERQKYRDLIAKERSAPQFALAEPDKAANGT
jgi:diaminopimelate decarboxylase